MLVLTQSVWCLYKMRQLIRTHCEPPGMFMHRGKAMCGHGKKAAMYKLRREVSGKTKLVPTPYFGLSAAKILGK